MSTRERWSGTKPLGLPEEEALGVATAVLKADGRITATYLFGSRGQGRADPEADLDLAILTTEDFTWEDYFALRAELTLRLHSERLDLVWLNRADPVLAFTVIKEGRVLFYRDPEELNAFEERAKKAFYDYTLYLRKRERERWSTAGSASSEGSKS